MVRTILTCVLILVYVTSANIFIYMLSNGMLDLNQRRLFHYYMTGGMTLLCFIDLKTITRRYYHQRFNEVAFSTLFANFILNIANRHGVLSEAAPAMFIGFNGVVFVLTTMILILGQRHGAFNEE